MTSKILVFLLFFMISLFTRTFSLCRGITSEIYDKELEKMEPTSTKTLIRFEEFTLQDPKNYPHFIVVKFDGA